MAAPAREAVRAYRWRRVLSEGKRLPSKHLLALQPAMSRAQLTEVHEAWLQLIVPGPLHRASNVPEDYQILSVEEFVKELKRRFPKSRHAGSGRADFQSAAGFC